MFHPRVINAGAFTPLFAGGRGLPGLGEFPLDRRHASGETAKLLHGPGFDRLPGDARERIVQEIERKQEERNLCFASGTISTSSGSFPPMASVLGNLGGGVQALADSRLGGKRRLFGGLLTLAAQADTSILGLCRLPLFGWLVGITLLTDTSLGSTTVAIGDANNTTLYKAAAALTATNTPTSYGIAGTFMTQLVQGYDGLTGNATNYSSSQTDPQSAAPASSGFGGLYEDMIVSLLAAAAPGSGNFVIMVDYVLD